MSEKPSVTTPQEIASRIYNNVVMIQRQLGSGKPIGKTSIDELLQDIRHGSIELIGILGFGHVQGTVESVIRDIRLNTAGMEFESRTAREYVLLGITMVQEALGGIAECGPAVRESVAKQISGGDQYEDVE